MIPHAANAMTGIPAALAAVLGGEPWRAYLRGEKT